MKTRRKAMRRRRRRPYPACETAICSRFTNVIKAEGNSLRKMLEWTEPRWYTCGVFGRACDVYQYDETTAIAVGYGSFGNLVADRTVIERYAERVENAERAEKDGRRKDVLCKLTSEFIKEVARKDCDKNDD